MIDLAGAVVVEALNDGQDAPALALQERRPTLLAGVQAALSAARFDFFLTVPYGPPTARCRRAAGRRCR
jgi:hypothetical protein